MKLGYFVLAVLGATLCTPVPDAEQQVKISTSDGKEMVVAKDLIMTSVLLKNMLEDISDTENAIPLPNVDKKTMKLILEWIEHHKNDDFSKNSDELHAEVAKMEFSEFDLKFFEKLTKNSFNNLYDVVLASNYLDIARLLEFSCRFIADQIRGKKAQEIRQLLGIKNDFTKEEEEANEKEFEFLK